MQPAFIRPRLGSGVFVHATAYIGGDVTVGDDCAILPHVSIRGDVSPITIGSRVNVQDGAVIHTQSDIPLDIADDVGIGHRAVVHCRRVGAFSLIGIGSIVLDEAEVGTDCIIAAGALVPPRMKVPDGVLVTGIPGRIARDLREEERRYIRFVIENYMKLGREHARGAYADFRDPMWDRMPPR